MKFLAYRVPAVVPGACIVVCWVLAIAVNAPGHMSYDSVVQLMEGRTGILGSMHPPVMSLLMGLADLILPGTALFQVVMTAPFFGALLTLVHCGSDRRVLAPLVPVLLFLLLSPVILIYQGIVWKDVLFANLAVFAISLAVLSTRVSSRPICGMALIIASAAIAGGAALIRQQGSIVPVMLAVGLALEARPQVSSMLRRGVGVIVIASAVMMAVNLGAHVWFVTPAPSVNGVGLQLLQRFDIVGMAAEGAALPVGLPAADREAIQHYVSGSFTHARVDTIKAPLLPAQLLSPTFPVKATWMEMLQSSPQAYLSHRIQHFRWLLWPKDIYQCVPVHIGVVGDPSRVTALQLSSTQRPSDARLYQYAKHWFDTVFFRHGFWLMVGFMLCGTLVLRRCRYPGDSIVLAGQCSSLAFSLSFLLIGIACDFRYLYFQPITVLLGLVYLLVGRGTLLNRAA